MYLSSLAKYHLYALEGFFPLSSTIRLVSLYLRVRNSDALGRVKYIYSIVEEQLEGNILIGRCLSPPKYSPAIAG